MGNVDATSARFVASNRAATACYDLFVGQPLRVVVVDDDDLSRRGMAELLGDRAELAVVASLTHEQAVRHPRWDGIDVAIVDAADEDRRGDQFPGVGVVEAIRDRGGDQTAVVVVTGHFFDDAVRRRMREAGADFFYNRIEFHDAATLYTAVLEADQQSNRGVPAESDPESMFRLGVIPNTRVNAGVRFLEERTPEQEGAGGSFRRARARLRYRSRFAHEARLNPVNADGRPPDRDQTAPSFPQIQRFLDWATKTKDRRHDTPGRRSLPGT